MKQKILNGMNRSPGKESLYLNQQIRQEPVLFVGLLKTVRDNTYPERKGYCNIIFRADSLRSETYQLLNPDLYDVLNRLLTHRAR